MLKYIFFWYLTIIRVFYTKNVFSFLLAFPLIRWTGGFVDADVVLISQEEAASTAWFLHFSDVALVQNYQFVSVPVCSIQAFPFLPLDYWISNQILKVFQVNLLMAQIKYAIMLWVNDNNKMSVYHLKYVTKPKKPWNEFQRGRTVHVSWWTTWQ